MLFSRRNDMAIQKPVDGEVKGNYDVQHENASPESSSAHEAGWGDKSQDMVDMQRLGKKQEFKVRIFLGRLVARVTNWWIEKLQLYQHARLCLHLYGNLGICLGVCLDLYQLSSLSKIGLIFLTHGRRSLSVGLTNGGFGGLFWTWCGTVLCYSTIVASLSELESM
jgi:hypothetical protein